VLSPGVASKIKIDYLRPQEVSEGLRCPMKALLERTRIAIGITEDI
jgi:hypothetical protein